MRVTVVFLALLVVILAASLTYQVRERRALESELAQMTAAVPTKPTSRREVQRQNGDLVASLDALLRENQRLRASAEFPKALVNEGSAGKLAVLKDILTRLPEQAIPELQFATDGDWYSAVDGPLETTDDYRLAMGKLRASAEKRFAAMAQPALQAYLKANNNDFPMDVSQLMPYFDRPMDTKVLQRYKVVPAAEVKNVGVGGAWAITQQSLIDSTYDSCSVIGPRGYGAFSKK